MKTKAISGALAISLAAVLWGFDGVVLTPRLHNLAVPFVVFLLHFIPFFLMQPVLGGTYGVLRRMPMNIWSTLLLVSLCGGIVGTFAIVKALFLVNFNQLSVVVLLQKLQPLFSITLAGLLLGERITRNFLAWATLAILGAYLLTFGTAFPALDGGTNTTLAAAWAALAAAAFGSATVFGKRLLGYLNFRQATFARYGMTTLLAMALLLVSGEGMPFEQVTRANWIIIALIGLTTGSGAIFLYYYGLGKVRAMVAAICELWLPLSAIVFDFVINGSILRPSQWAGAALLVLAIFKVSAQTEEPAQAGETQASSSP